MTLLWSSEWKQNCHLGDAKRRQVEVFAATFISRRTDPDEPCFRSLVTPKQRGAGFSARAMANAAFRRCAGWLIVRVRSATPPGQMPRRQFCIRGFASRSQQAALTTINGVEARRGVRSDRPSPATLRRHHPQGAPCLEEPAASAPWLRHCARSHMADGNVDLRLVRENLGHASLPTTSLYLHADDDQRHRETAEKHRIDS